MTDLLELYNLAEQHGTPVYWFDLGATESLSLQMEDGSCAIAMDPWRIPTLAEEKVKLAHELGHCETGAFYNRYATRDVRQKHENRANSVTADGAITARSAAELADTALQFSAFVNGNFEKEELTR